MEDVSKYLALALKWWWLLIILPLVGGVIGYVIQKDEKPIYTAFATIIVGETIQSAAPSSGDFQISSQLAGTYADMALRQPVLQGVVESLGLNKNWRSLRGQVRVRAVPGTQFLEVAVQSTDPEEARVIADEIVQQLILLSPTNLQNLEQSQNQLLINEQIQKLKARIDSGQERIQELEEAMKTALSAEQIQKLEREIDALANSIKGWETNYVQLLIAEGNRKSPNYLAVIEPAQVGPPSQSEVEQSILIGAVAGLFLAAGVIYLLDFIDTSIKTIDEVTETIGILTLGQISQIKGDQNQDRLITTVGLFSPAAEAYRMIRSNIQFMSVDYPIKSILVTSANPGEGKSFTAANLGIIMAQAGYQTLIVDADLRRPTQHQIFKVPNFQGGLTALLRSPELDVKNQLLDTKIVENLRVLTSGALPPNPAELLGSKRMVELMTILKEHADVIIFDSPPNLAVIDASVIAHRVDGVTLVINAGRTRRKAASQAVSNLEQAGANLLGVVLNRVSEKRGDYYYQGYYTSHIPATDHQESQQRPKRRWQWFPFFK